MMALSKAEARLRETKLFMMRSDEIDQIVAGIPDDYDIIGPVKDGLAINYSKIRSASELATGFTAREAPGSYRLAKQPINSSLGGLRAMNSPKRFTFRPEELLYRTRADSYGNFQYESPADDDLPKQAFFGVKACDVSGMGVLDRTFNSQFHDPTYDRRRRDTIVIGINCFEPGANCFCSTFDAGPDLKGGYDIGLSFLGDDLLIDIATDAGAGILAQTDMRAADRRLLNDARELAGKARRAMIKSFDLNKAVKLLRANYEHPYWKEPSARCLSCANCINVCPTCYCSRLIDLSSIDRQEFARVRMWDACQNLDFAATCAENFRHKRIDRLRQWVNHKLNWTIDQYGVAGCVGCGRCITWCPVGIDITEPVRRIGERGASLDG